MAKTVIPDTIKDTDLIGQVGHIRNLGKGQTWPLKYVVTGQHVVDGNLHLSAVSLDKSPENPLIAASHCHSFPSEWWVPDEEQPATPPTPPPLSLQEALKY